MELFRDLKTLTLPWPTKLFIIGLLALSLITNAGLFAYSFEVGRWEVVSATAQLFGALLPVVLIALVLSQADTGVNALKRRTEVFFSHILPQVLSGIHERPGEFYLPQIKRRSPVRQDLCVILMNHNVNDCYCDYLIYVPVIDQPDAWKAMIIRLEVNVGRINFNLCIPDVLLDGHGASKEELLRTGFQHTLSGASAGGGQAYEHGLGSSYQFLDQPTHRGFKEFPMTCIVGARFAAREFLWDSAEQLYFAQDLMFMLRAFLADEPRLFADVQSKAAPTSDEEFLASLRRHAGSRKGTH